MADIGELRYLYTGRIEERDGSYVIELPEREVVDGDLEEGETSQIGVFGPLAEDGDGAQQSAAATTEPTAEPAEATSDGDAAPGATAATGAADAASAASDAGAADEGGDATAAAADSGGIGGAESLDEVEVRDPQEPPVDEGETRTVEIVDEGEQGDGLARIDRGYIVFVPGTEPGDTVEIRITDTKENFAFGELVE